MMTPLPSISKVYSMLIQEEKQREIRACNHFLTDSASLVAEVHKSNQFYKGRLDKIEGTHGRFEKFETRKPNLFCNYCKKPRHSVDKCYKIHGFPPNFKFKGGRRIAAMVQANDQENLAAVPTL